MYALIHYKGDNEWNTTVPAHCSLPFDSVGRICKANGNGTSGSAVHIKGCYLLTANHVKVQTHVTFDGSVFHKLDPDFAPVQIGASDLKLIRLLDDPDLEKMRLFDKPRGDTKVVAWVVGWGVGIKPGSETRVNQTRTWMWGGSDTITKRWGTNYVEEYKVWRKDINSPLLTLLDAQSGPDEVGLTMHDSGAGMFVFNDNKWKLSGIASRAPHHSCKFSDTGKSSSKNYFVRMYYYREMIENLISQHELTELSTPAASKGYGLSSLVSLALSGLSIIGLFLFSRALKNTQKPTHQ